MNPPRPKHSLPPEYFDRKYAEKLDYWNFETSEYEAAKYAHTLASLPWPRYRHAFEIGCSIGVLTARLKERCDRLLAVDVSDRALARARARCPEAEVKLMRFPREFPTGESFDLIVLSEVGYYWSRAELAKAQARILGLLSAGGDLVLVHWTSEKTDYPLTGAEVHESFAAIPSLLPIRHDPRPCYQLDVFRRR